jgi:FG-GAP-like repeat/ASPIC and UnbV
MPRDYPSLADYVFRNDNGRFLAVTAQAGFVDPDGRGLGVVAANLDDDNKIDLYVANDMSANYLFHNLGAFRFEETGQVAGAAVSADGFFKSGMGIACGDLDGDGELDLAVTNFFGESTTLYRNLGSGMFVDRTATHFGLGPSRQVEAVEVRWPSGKVDHHERLVVDREYRLREGAIVREVNNKPPTPASSKSSSSLKSSGVPGIAGGAR